MYELVELTAPGGFAEAAVVLFVLYGWARTLWDILSWMWDL